MRRLGCCETATRVHPPYSIAAIVLFVINISQVRNILKVITPKNMVNMQGLPTLLMTFHALSLYVPLLRTLSKALRYINTSPPIESATPQCLAMLSSMNHYTRTAI